jgi:hypothetical protein
VRAGGELAVINVSSTGVLVEGEARLLPGRHVDIHVVTATGRTLVRSRVVRAWVQGLWSDRTLYRGALAFEETLEFELPATQIDAAALDGAAGNTLPVGNSGLPGHVGITYPQQATQP